VHEEVDGAGGAMSESEDAANNARFHAARAEEMYWQERKEREYFSSAAPTPEAECEALARDLFVSMFSGEAQAITPSKVSFAASMANMCLDIAKVFQAERDARRKRTAK